MRILFLALDIDLGKPRGDTIHTVELSRALWALGHDVSLVVGADGPVRTLIPGGISVRVLRGSDIRIVKAIQRLTKDSRSEIVYERRFSPKIGLSVCALSGIPLVVEVNGILREELSQSRASRRRPVKDRVLSALLRRVDRFVVVSIAIGEDLVRSFGVEESRIRVIGNGVDIERFRPLAKQAACNEAGLPVVPRLVFIGNLAPWRDFDVVLRSLSALQRIISGLELLIVGGGRQEQPIRERVQQLGLEALVRFAGEVPPERIPLLIAASDIGLLPERIRALDISPLKLFEYLACGRPVVASRVPGLELVESMNCGRLYSPADEPGMIVAIRELLADETLRRDAGERGRAFVERERSWAAVAAGVTAVLREATDSVP